jgi:hypothetical protein
MGWTAGGDSSLFHSVQNGPRAHPTSNPMGIGAISLGGGVKRPGHEADHSPQSSAEVSIGVAITSLPPIMFMV